MAANPQGYAGTMECGAPGSASSKTTDVTTCTGLVCAAGYSGLVKYGVGAKPGAVVAVSGCEANKCAALNFAVGVVGGGAEPCQNHAVLRTNPAAARSCTATCAPGYAASAASPKPKGEETKCAGCVRRANEVSVCGANVPVVADRSQCSSCG